RPWVVVLLRNGICILLTLLFEYPIKKSLSHFSRKAFLLCFLTTNAISPSRYIPERPLEGH
ncbi:MAG TPA: hypothetical protein VKA10_08150, partial [Prolixibacteraceae bacterium]|nr:hypothetical protein [Prolixibacteraceae bacterium]